MASLNELCDAIANTISTHTEFDMFAYSNPADIKAFPAVVVEPEDANFAFSMVADTEWELRVYVLMSTAGSTDLALRQLNQLIDGYGPNSVRQILLDHEDVGLPSTTVFAKGVSGYSGSFEVLGLNAVGAIIAVHAITDSRVQSAQQ